MNSQKRVFDGITVLPATHMFIRIWNKSSCLTPQPQSMRSDGTDGCTDGRTDGVQGVMRPSAVEEPYNIMASETTD